MHCPSYLGINMAIYGESQYAFAISGNAKATERSPVHSASTGKVLNKTFLTRDLGPLVVTATSIDIRRYMYNVLT